MNFSFIHQWFGKSSAHRLVSYASICVIITFFWTICIAGFFITKELKVTEAVKRGILYAQSLFEMQEIANLHRQKKMNLLQSGTLSRSSLTPLEKSMQNIFTKAVEQQRGVTNLLGINDKNLQDLGKLNVQLTALEQQWNALININQNTSTSLDQQSYLNFIDSVQQLQRIVFHQLELYPYPTLEIATLISMICGDITPIFQSILKLQQIIDENTTLGISATKKMTLLLNSIQIHLNMLQNDTNRVSLERLYLPPVEDSFKEQALSSCITLLEKICPNIEQETWLEGNTLSIQQLQELLPAATRACVLLSQSLSLEITALFNQKDMQIQMRNIVIYAITGILALCTIICISQLVSSITTLDEVAQSVPTSQAHKAAIKNQIQKSLGDCIQTLEIQTKGLAEVHYEEAGLIKKLQLLQSSQSTEIFQKIGRDVSLSLTQLNEHITEIQQIVSNMHENQETLNTKLRNAQNAIPDAKSSTYGLHVLLNNLHKILEQTNVLCINGVIEADKAGIAGKGFASIANAIQEFINQILVLYKKIDTKLEEFQTITTQSKNILTTCDTEHVSEVKRFATLEHQLEHIHHFLRELIKTSDNWQQTGIDKNTSIDIIIQLENYLHKRSGVQHIEVVCTQQLTNLQNTIADM